jgi:hypothetical protein
MSKQLRYESNKLEKNIIIEKIIYLLGVHKPMSIKPLLPTQIENGNIFMKKDVKDKN